MQVLIDVSCGPWYPTKPLTRHLDAVFNINPSLETFNNAKSLSAESPDGTASSKSPAFYVGSAEEVNGLLQKPEPGQIH